MADDVIDPRKFSFDFPVWILVDNNATADTVPQSVYSFALATHPKVMPVFTEQLYAERFASAGNLAFTPIELRDEAGMLIMVQQTQVTHVGFDPTVDPPGSTRFFICDVATVGRHLRSRKTE